MTFVRMATLRANGLRGLTRIVLYLVLSLLVLFGEPSLAQEVDAPAAAAGSGSVVAPSPWLGLILPVPQGIDLKLYGFFIGDLDVPSAQVDVVVRTTRFLTITPSYLYYSVPASGLDDLANLPGAFTDSYDEHQFRIDGTVTFSIRKFEISVRNMYVRRFRPAPADDSNRYRGRLGIAYPLALTGGVWKPFALYEAYHEWENGGWNKDRIWTGVTLSLMKHVVFQPSYLWERTDGIKTVHYLLFGVILSTR